MMESSNVDTFCGSKFLETKRIGQKFLDYGQKIYSEKIMKYGHQMMECGQNLFAYWKACEVTDSIRLQIDRFTCQNRLCPACNTIRVDHFRKQLFSRLLEYGYDNFIFLTITYPRRVEVGESRAVFDDMTHNCYRRLFRMPVVRAAYRGGFSAIEGNMNKSKEDTINPHIHNLIHCFGYDLRENKSVLRFQRKQVYQDKVLEYMKYSGKSLEQVEKENQKWLKRGKFTQLMWSALTTDVGLGSICDVRKVDAKAPLELLKYFTKTLSFSNTDKFVEFFLAMKGKRFYSSWGTLKMSNGDDEKVVEAESVEENEEPKAFSQGYTLKRIGYVPDLVKLAYATDGLENPSQDILDAREVRNFVVSKKLITVISKDEEEGFDEFARDYGADVSHASDYCEVFQ